MVVGVVGIVGGIKMIRKGKKIRRKQETLTLTPLINPFDDSYGLAILFSF